MTALIATDLDRTLIYSRRFFDTIPPAHQCVEIYRDEPISYMTPAAADLLRQLTTRHVVVPTTTRTIVQYTRITLPGAPYRYAITSNGGNLLIDGAPDRQWTRTVAARIRAGGPPLTHILAELQTRIDDSWVHNLRTAEDLFCYLVVDEAALPSEFLADWQQWCVPRGWAVSRQGRKIYTVPRSLCKAEAVAALHHQLIDTGELPAEAPILAAGDGALDAAMLELASAAIRPAHGELHTLGWQRAHLTVSNAIGARAAEDILAWFTARMSDATPDPHRPVQHNNAHLGERKDNR
ncbi:HAD family hydrolase [Mycolicibacterium llatzerense]|uniref:HAD family hydrolase n=1 Tax=Mycolicibacterium llatzerense TaxID=280871 RepID=UPI000ADA2B02|nr:HAD family hydrolase [Mycolicibacterium llatzerense]